MTSNKEAGGGGVARVVGEAERGHRKSQRSKRFRERSTPSSADVPGKD